MIGPMADLHRELRFWENKYATVMIRNTTRTLNMYILRVRVVMVIQVSTLMRLCKALGVGDLRQKLQFLDCKPTDE